MQDGMKKIAKQNCKYVVKKKLMSNKEGKKKKGNIFYFLLKTNEHFGQLNILEYVNFHFPNWIKLL